MIKIAHRLDRYFQRKTHFAGFVRIIHLCLQCPDEHGQAYPDFPICAQRVPIEHRIIHHEDNPLEIIGSFSVEMNC